MTSSIDTYTVTDTGYDVHDADAYTIATRDEYALLHAVDDNSSGDDNQFVVTTYYCNDNGDVFKADSEIDDYSVGITAEEKADDLQHMAKHHLYDCEAHFGAEFTWSPVRR